MFEMELNSKIYVAGHKGMVGSAIVRCLKKQGYTNIITKSHSELNLINQAAVEDFFKSEKPEYVFLAAAKVGGIEANRNALADFMYENMMIEMNVINSAFKNGCKKLEFLGSSCIYPRLAPQPMKEDCLLTSALEPTNEAYALAKISGLKYCEYLNRQYGTDYISVMPTNLYGPNDNYHPTGNKTGLLLLDYICSVRTAVGTMPKKAVLIKTIVTTSLADKIAENYGVQTINVLTGFKYIGEQIGILEKKGEINRYIFGFEESYGYLSGTYVRDKDAVNPAILIAEMTAYYKNQGITLDEKIKMLYLKYGYCINNLYTYSFEGMAGKAKMQSIMNAIRKTQAVDNYEVIDYKTGVDNLPKSDVIEIKAKDFSLVVRPSGTEPKLKIYTSVTAVNRKEAEKAEKILIENFMKKYI